VVGTINLALTQQLDEFGKPLSGGQLYFIQAGTISTPQNAYQDSALTIPWPNPIPLDAAGRIPMFYLADGQIKVRLQDSMGVVKFVADNLLVIGPSAGGGGGGGSVDATTVLQTGDIKFRYDNQVINGFVRLNGLTIGSASSGASEFANSGAQALFQFLWGIDSTLVVTPGGRGASAAADWAANKQITLPDGRSKLLGALDAMGNTNLGYWTGVTFSKGNATTLGSLGGLVSQNITLATTNLPAISYTPTGTVTVNLTNNVNIWRTGSTVGLSGGVGAAYDAITLGVISTSFVGNPASLGGFSTAFSVAPPLLLITVYMKL
jgi:hypothetical protein